MCHQNNHQYDTSIYNFSILRTNLCNEQPTETHPLLPVRNNVHHLLKTPNHIQAVNCSHSGDATGNHTEHTEPYRPYSHTFALKKRPQQKRNRSISKRSRSGPYRNRSRFSVCSTECFMSVDGSEPVRCRDRTGR